MADQNHHHRPRTAVIKLGTHNPSHLPPLQTHFPNQNPPPYKTGTTSIIDSTTHLPFLSVLSSIAETCVKLRRAGHRVVLVSSGAVGVGMGVLGVGKKPTDGMEIRVCIYSFVLMRFGGLKGFGWSVLTGDVDCRRLQP